MWLPAPWRSLEGNIDTDITDSAVLLHEVAHVLVGPEEADTAAVERAIAAWLQATLPRRCPKLRRLLVDMHAYGMNTSGMRTFDKLVEIGILEPRDPTLPEEALIGVFTSRVSLPTRAELLA